MVQRKLDVAMNAAKPRVPETAGTARRARGTPTRQEWRECLVSSGSTTYRKSMEHGGRQAGLHSTANEVLLVTTSVQI